MLLLLAFWILEGALLLAVPVRLGADWDGEGRFRLAWGPFAAEARVPAPSGRALAHHARRRKAHGRGGVPGGARLYAAYARALADLRARSRPLEVSLGLAGGVGDPAASALLYGSAMALAGGIFAANGVRWRADARPSLTASEIRLRGGARAGVRGGAWMAAAVGFARALQGR